MRASFLRSLSPHSRLEDRNSLRFADEGNLSLRNNLLRMTRLANDDPGAGSQNDLTPTLCAHPGCSRMPLVTFQGGKETYPTQSHSGEEQN